MADESIVNVIRPHAKMTKIQGAETNFWVLKNNFEFQSLL